MVISWLVTRLLMLVVLATPERFVVGDVFYYYRKIAALFSVGLDQDAERVPDPGGLDPLAPVRGHLGLPDRLPDRLHRLHAGAGRGSSPWPSGRTGGRRHDRAIDFWLLFVFLIGPLSYLRFDLLPAVLAGGALLAARRRPWVAGALTGLGAAIKLWPALLVGPLSRPTGPPGGRSRSASSRSGVGLAVLSLILGGWSRLISPLTWQSGRGLQIESIWATPLMVARAVRPSSWLVDISKYQAYEIFGSGVSTWVADQQPGHGAGLGGHRRPVRPGLPRRQPHPDRRRAS